MKKLNTLLLIIALLMTVLYVKDENKIGQIEESIKSYELDIGEMEEKISSLKSDLWATENGESNSKLPETTFENGVYLAYAELVESNVEEGDYKFKLLNVTLDEDSDGIYTFHSDFVVYEDAPYVLTMESNGTKETSDDTISVVWIADP